MPELPEVETMRRGILAVEQCSIAAVEFVRTRYRPILVTPSCQQFGRRAGGQRILRVERLGKRIVLRLENEDAIVIEPRMTGLLLLADPPSQDHVRVQFALHGKVRQLSFWDRRGLGTVRLFDPTEFQKELLQRIGPDALQVTADEFQSRLQSSRREIKVALLDQQAIAGIGNLYASEMLHVAGIDPRKRSCHMSGRQWHALHDAMRNVLLEAIDYEGSTLSDGTYRNALNQSGSYQNCHRVYSRAGQPCPRCLNQPVQRIVQAQRSTFFCPACQKRR